MMVPGRRMKNARKMTGTCMIHGHALDLLRRKFPEPGLEPRGFAPFTAKDTAGTEMNVTVSMMQEPDSGHARRVALRQLVAQPVRLVALTPARDVVGRQEWDFRNLEAVEERQAVGLARRDGAMVAEEQLQVERVISGSITGSVIMGTNAGMSTLCPGGQRTGLPERAPQDAATACAINGVMKASVIMGTNAVLITMHHGV